jgi:hypothetical protein
MHVDNEELRGNGAIEWSERWRGNLLKLWQGAQAVIVQHCADPDKKRGFKKVQRIKLQTSPRSSTPLTAVDDVVDAIAESIYGWLALRVEAGEIESSDEMHFAIEVQRLSPSKDTPARQKFFVSASLDGSAEDQYDNYEAEALSELERLRQMHLESLQREKDQQTVHIENLHDTIIKLATISQAPMKEAAAMMEMSNTMAMGGLQSTLNAAAMRFDIESKRVEQEAKTRRSEMWLKNIGQHILPYIPAAAASFLDKLRGGSGAVPGPSAGVPPTAPPPDPGSGAETDGSGDPLDAWCHELARLRDSITEEQAEALHDTLAESQRTHFAGLLNSKTFLESTQHLSRLIDAFEVGEDAAGLDDLTASLKEIFDLDQQIAFYQYYRAVCTWMARQDASNV